MAAQSVKGAHVLFWSAACIAATETRHFQTPPHLRSWPHPCRLQRLSRLFAILALFANQQTAEQCRVSDFRLWYREFFAELQDLSQENWRVITHQSFAALQNAISV